MGREVAGGNQTQVQGKDTEVEDSSEGQMQKDTRRTQSHRHGTRMLDKGKALDMSYMRVIEALRKGPRKKKVPPDWWDVKLGFQTVLFKLASHYICCCECSHILLFPIIQLKMDRTGISLIFTDQ